MNYKGKKDEIHHCLFCDAIIPFKGYGYFYKYCNSKCQGDHKKSTKRVSNLELFNNEKLIYRRRIHEILVERDGNKCSVCGITEWNNKPIRLWVDHIDGNATNNKPENFRLVCPNCDSQSETFGAKNKGNGRRFHGLKPYG